MGHIFHAKLVRPMHTVMAQYFNNLLARHHELGKKLERTIRFNKQNVIAAISLIFYMRERLLMRA
jgi:hypothetical protein